MRAKMSACILGLAALAACSSIKVESDLAPGASLDGLQTYAWLPIPEDAGYLRADSRFMERRIFTAADSAMLKKGYRKVADEEADFFLAYQLTGIEGVTADVTFDTYSSGTPRDRLRYPVNPSVPYVQGTLIIDLLTPERQLLWRGTASGSAEVPDQAERAKTLSQAASRIIGRLPAAG